MADFIVEKKEQEARRNPAGVSECLIDPRLRMQRVGLVGLGHVDNNDAITEDVANQVRPKAIPLDLYYPMDDGVDFSFYTLGYGQCALIRKGAISRSPGETSFHCTVVPVTAKHNLRRVVKNKDEVYIPKRAEMEVEVGKADFVSEDLGWEPSPEDELDIRAGEEEDSRPAICLWGLDISIGREISFAKNPLTDPAYAFDLVGPQFKPMKDQKVAIVVNFRRKAKPTTESIKGAGPPVIDDDDLLANVKIEEIYGKPDSVNIYTGKITYVGKQHIEYTCNTFTGCSGALVFLLDEDQPNSVQRCDYGKAIAVHSGSHPFLPNRNFGFLVRSHPFFESFESE